MQVELTFGLRKRMFDPSSCGTKWEQNWWFHRIVECFRDFL
ncbi:MAG: hypothetical protein ACRERU_14600 [Methylococcales bacterium]